MDTFAPVTAEDYDRMTAQEQAERIASLPPELEEEFWTRAADLVLHKGQSRSEAERQAWAAIAPKLSPPLAPTG